VANAMSAGGLVMSNDYRASTRRTRSPAGRSRGAMADLFAERLNNTHGALSKALGKQVDVPKERQFLGSTPIGRRSTACGPATWPC